VYGLKTDKEFVNTLRSKNESFDDSLMDDNPNVKRRRMVTIDPKDLIGRTLINEYETDGKGFRARIVRDIVDKEHELKKKSE
jgi:hypothetical protein